MVLIYQLTGFRHYDRRVFLIRRVIILTWASAIACCRDDANCFEIMYHDTFRVRSGCAVFGNGTTLTIYVSWVSWRSSLISALILLIFLGTSPPPIAYTEIYINQLQISCCDYKTKRRYNL